MFPRAAVDDCRDSRSATRDYFRRHRAARGRTAFVGRGTNFVWVAQCFDPSRSLEAFPQTVFQPQVIFKIRPYSGSGPSLRWSGSASGGAPWLSAARSALRVAGGRTARSFLLPSLARAKASRRSGRAWPRGAHARPRRVGIYDVVISSKEPDVLVLAPETGLCRFAEITPSCATTWRKVVFVLARLARDADDSSPATPTAGVRSRLTKPIRCASPGSNPPAGSISTLRRARARARLQSRAVREAELSRHRCGATIRTKAAAHPARAVGRVRDQRARTS